MAKSLYTRGGTRYTDQTLPASNYVKYYASSPRDDGHGHGDWDGDGDGDGSGETRGIGSEDAIAESNLYATRYCLGIRTSAATPHRS